MEVDDIREHLIIYGFDEGYTKWVWHGENTPINECRNNDLSDDEIMGDRLDDMIRDVEDEINERPHVLERLLSDAQKPLYPGCTKYRRLSGLLKLFNLKAKHGWSDKSFTDLLNVLKDLLPEENELPNWIYEAKKILCPMVMGYKKIHACPNDCILYRNEYENCHSCVKCGASCYKKKEGNDNDDDDNVVTKGPPAKVLWYLPIIPRFKRLYANARDAKNLT